MILHSHLSPRPHATTAGMAAGAAIAPVPNWLRRAVPGAQALAGQSLEDVALAAGAALGALDAVVRRQERWAGVWRQRLALCAAAVTAKQAGRVEDEPALRDAVLLTRAGDDVGPAGRMFLGWRRFAQTPAKDLLTEASIGVVLDEFGFARADDELADLADALRQLSSSRGVAGMLTGALASAERLGYGRSLGVWLADAVLAQRLGWTHAVPLLGTEAAVGTSAGLRRSAPGSAASSIETDPESVKSLIAAQARAALRAIDLAAEIERRADRLLAVAPKLRAKGADAVVDKLLANDAIVASEKIAGMSDRGLRRLFDRLVELDAVRELSGRPTFRMYGL